MKWDFSFKKKVIWIIYILIGFTAIKYIYNKDLELKMPVIDLENEENEVVETTSFDILDINKIDIDNSDKKEYSYTIQMNKDSNDAYLNLSVSILNKLKKEADFEKLYIKIIDKESKELFTFSY